MKPIYTETLNFKDYSFFIYVFDIIYHRRYGIIGIALMGKQVINFPGKIGVGIY